MDFINFGLSDIGYIIIALVGILFLKVWYQRFKTRETSRVVNYIRDVMTENKVFKELRTKTSKIYDLDEKYTAFTFSARKESSGQGLKDLASQYLAVKGLNFLDNKNARIVACNKVEYNLKTKNKTNHDSLFFLIVDENNVLYILIGDRLGDSNISDDIKITIFDLTSPMIISKEYMISIARASISDAIIPEGKYDPILISESSLKLEENEIKLTIQWNKHNTIFLKYNMDKNIFRQ